MEQYAHQEGYYIHAGDPGQKPADPDDRNIAALFHVEPVLNSSRSHQEKRPCYDNVIMVTLTVKDDGVGTSVTHRATNTHKQRFPEQWQRFARQMQEQNAPGTPLKFWAAMTPASLLELRGAGFTTVEQLAENGPEEWRQRAKEWLDRDRAKDDRIRELEAKLAKLTGDAMAHVLSGSKDQDQSPSGFAASLIASGHTQPLPDHLAQSMETDPGLRQKARRGRPPGSKNKPKAGAE